MLAVSFVDLSRGSILGERSAGHPRFRPQITSETVSIGEALNSSENAEKQVISCTIVQTIWVQVSPTLIFLGYFSNRSIPWRGWGKIKLRFLCVSLTDLMYLLKG